MWRNDPQSQKDCQCISINHLATIWMSIGNAGPKKIEGKASTIPFHKKRTDEARKNDGR
jgi:hypothetical protein